MDLEFYAPGKYAAADDQLQVHLDASNLDNPLNKYAIHYPDYIYDLQYDLPPQTDEDSCFKLVRKWVNSCETSHPRCEKSRPPTAPPFTMLPNRVIDVGTQQSNVDPKIFETSGRCGRYVTLSHRWPAELTCRTTSQTIDQYLKAIKLSTMPAPFRDAVIVCRKLGIRYLWIDALCIIQDSDDDWLEESSLMGSYYSDAVFTISALNSGVNEQGLFIERPATQKVVFDSPLEGDTALMGIRVCLPSVDEDLENAPLSGRGWIYQERLLSRATLHYGPNQMFWECRTIVIPESSKPVLPKLHTLTYEFERWLQMETLMGGLAMGQWLNIVTEFSRKTFTVKTDKFAAISLVAKRFMAHGLMNSPFIAGMWIEDLHQQLLWLCDNRPSRNIIGPVSAPLNHVVDANWTPRSPSWSWLSVDYPIAPVFNDYAGINVKADPDFDIIGMRCKSKIDARAYHENRANIELHLQGKLIEIHNHRLSGGARESLFEKTITFTDTSDPLHISIDPGHSIPDTCYFFKIAGDFSETFDPFNPSKTWFLILELVSEENSITFRRIGLGSGERLVVEEHFRKSNRIEFFLM